MVYQVSGFYLLTSEGKAERYHATTLVMLVANLIL